MSDCSTHAFDVPLKPCPFCGGEADEYEGDYGNGIYCMMCGAMVGEPIHLEYRTTKRVSIDEAIAAWNTRAERTCEVEVRDTAYGGYTRHCGNCGADLDCDTRNKQNYCPNCGAKVVGE